MVSLVSRFRSWFEFPKDSLAKVFSSLTAGQQRCGAGRHYR